MTLSTKDLYNRALTIEREVLLLLEDLKELKTEATYHKDDNTSGLEKEVVAKVMKAARASAKEDDLEGKVAELNEVMGLQEELED